MMKLHLNYRRLAVLSLVGALAGCNSAPPQEAADGHAHGGHAHAEAGPHGGTILELGAPGYHAELVHDDAAQQVTVHILDGSAQSPAAIAAKEIAVNLVHDGAAQQFKLAASPVAADAADSSSRFVSTQAELLTELEHEHADAQLVVDIDGRQYRAPLMHDHDHAEHE